MDNFIPAHKCTSPSQVHDYEHASEEDLKKGYSMVCSTCGAKFMVISKRQMEALLDFIDVKVDFVTDRGNN